VSRLADDPTAIAALAQAACARATLRRREDDLADLASPRLYDPGPSGVRRPRRRRFAGLTAR
jgi:hypothetical protein